MTGTTSIMNESIRVIMAYAIWDGPKYTIEGS